jgi:hypothetical protein
VERRTGALGADICKSGIGRCSVLAVAERLVVDLPALSLRQLAAFYALGELVDVGAFGFERAQDRAPRR